MRYLCIMEIVQGKPKRLLGTNIYPVDGRVSNGTALLRGAEWAETTAAHHKITSYIVVLFRAARLSGQWCYVAHKPVSGNATLSSIQSELE
jgi:hypothetical protein